jgi:hypothetical protein
MAMNLRLKPETAEALRRASAEQGRSQQQIAQEAIEIALGLAVPPRSYKPPLPPPRIPYMEPGPLLPLPPGVTSSLELLDREDRF